MHYSKNHIHAEVQENSDRSWYLTGFYGEPETYKSGETWLLKKLKPDSGTPLLVSGDFNEITQLSEKKGGI